MDYDLSRLGSREFEHLVQSLAKCVLGPGARVFGDGPDGGREISFHGPVPYPHRGQEWDGYGVVQAKYRQVPAARPSDGTWLQREIRKELEDWASAGSKRGAVPEFIVFATNVRLSAAAGSGGIDRIERFIAGEAFRRGIALKGWAVWHRDEICRFLDTHPQVRQSYLAFLTASDVIAQLVGRDSSHALPADVAAVMRAHAAGELIADQWLRLGQAGAEPSAGRIGLGPVAVDLNAACEAGPDGPRTVLAGQHVIERGDSVLRPSRQPAVGRPHILLLGGPGQGKTTLGQLVCQAYRAAMFDEDDRLLTAQVRDVLRALRRDLAEMGFRAPRCHRWPLRVALHAYAQALAEQDSPSLLQFMARQMSLRTSGVTEDALRHWQQTWPWLLVLDGLDEVARPAREAVLQGIEEFLSLARSFDADLLVVATTRPQDYRGEFHPGDYEPLTLTDMSPEEALHYAGRLTQARHCSDPDMHATVMERTKAAADNPMTWHLMRSPLQVTIMSLLVEKRLRMPQNRYELFDAYYATIYAREADKPGPTGELVAENQIHIDWLHQYAGLTIQTDEVVTEPADILTMPLSDLRDRLRSRLLEETADPLRADALSAALTDAATERLVLLVSPQDDAVGFEVKSLQEYCAARALLSGPDTQIVPRLGYLATDKAWYQTWLLAAAGLFTTRPYLRDKLLTVLRDLDGNSPAHTLLLPGAHLALAMLDEDLARRYPKYHIHLAQHAAELITAPNDFAFDYALTFRQPGMAQTLTQAADRSDQVRERLVNTARTALGGQGLRAVFCLRTLARWARTDGCLQSAALQLLDSAAQSMSGEHLAAVKLFTSKVLGSTSAPTLPQQTPAATGSTTTLAAFLPGSDTAPAPGHETGDAQAALRWVVKWAANIQVTNELVDDVTVPLADQDALDHGPLLTESIWEWDMLPHAQRLLAEAAMAQPPTGWSIARAFLHALHDIASWDFALGPVTVAGIND
ncbi:NACHT domain-containing protein [Kitasatospora sp. NPDC056651]|uniref:NACHT domain-containing protein n=1 Tax=Kitasatospora sp. NPDC056651 TaxID=3345892 RepID=UPI0036A4E352